MPWNTNFWKVRNTPNPKLDGNTLKEEFKLEAQIVRRKAWYVLRHPRRWYKLRQIKKELRTGLAELLVELERGSGAAVETAGDRERGGEREREGEREGHNIG